MDKLERLAGLLEALACDCDETDGWQDAAPTVREAADEITRLKGEVEELRQALAETHNDRAAKQALIDELVEGLEEIKELADTAPPSTEVQMIWERSTELLALRTHLQSRQP